MATIDSAAHWNDGAAGCRNQRAPRIGEIQRHKAVELERSSSGSTSSNSSTNSSTNKSPTSTTPTATSSFVLRASSNNSASNPTEGAGGIVRREPSGDVDTSSTVDGRSTFSDPLSGMPEDGISTNVESGGSFSSDVESKRIGGRVSFHSENMKLSRQILPATAAPNEGIASVMNCVPSLHAIQQPIVVITANTIMSTTNNCKQSLSPPVATNIATAFPTLTTSTSLTLTNESLASSIPHSSVPPPPIRFANQTRYKRSSRVLPKTKSLDIVETSRDEADPEDQSDNDDDQDVSEGRDSADRFAGIFRQTTVIQRPQNRFIANAQSHDDTKATSTATVTVADPSLAGLLRNIQRKGAIPKMQSVDSRSNSPRTPSSPGGSPLGSPRSNRRRTPLKESRRISIEQSGDAVQVNQYKLMEQIGKGAYGLVKLAYNKDDSTHYAMKMLSKSKLIKKAGLIGRGPKAKAPIMTPLQRVYKEIAVLKKLNHPNVVKLVEVLDDPAEDCLYLAFELEHQGEVLRIPTDRPLSEERTWSVFRDVVQGLEYLHYQRIIHSDMKPGNLLLGDDGHVKIADLGVCTEFLDDDATMNNKSPAGTPAFRAPETLLEGEHYYSGRAADIWSLGATLYALVFGNVPFIGLTVPAVYDKIKNETLKYPNFPAISDDLRDLITRMLIKDPSQRITLPQIKEYKWVTAEGKYPLPSEEDNCRLVELETDDLTTVCRSVPKLFDTFVLIKAMLKNHSFQNPFARTPSGRAPQRGGSRLERFVTAGRSKSAPGDYDVDSRHMSSEKCLPVVTEAVPSSNAESFEQSSEDPV